MYNNNDTAYCVGNEKALRERQTLRARRSPPHRRTESAMAVRQIQIPPTADHLCGGAGGVRPPSLYQISSGSSFHSKVIRGSQIYPPPLEGAGPPKFNQLEMVTTFTYRPSLVKIDARNFELAHSLIAASSVCISLGVFFHFYTSRVFS